MDTTVEWDIEVVMLFVFGLAVLMLIFLIWLIVISVKLKKTNKKYQAFMAGQDVADLHQVITIIQQKLQLSEGQIMQLQEQLSHLQQQWPLQKNKVGIVRFNPFGESGHNLSFAVAIVNEQQDGVVLSAIHNRETSLIYAKPVTQGNSIYKLTPEELAAIEQAE